MNSPGPGPSHAPPLKILYLIWRYPECSQTFVYREILHVSQHTPVRVMAWEHRQQPKRSSEPHTQGEAGDGMIHPSTWGLDAGTGSSGGAGQGIPLDCLPRGPKAWKLILPLFWALFTRPIRLIQALAWGWPFKRLKDLVKGVYLARWMKREEIDALHIHFASEAAELGAVASMISGISFGMTVHATELYDPAPSLPSLIEKSAWILTISAFNQRRLMKDYGAPSTLIRCAPPLPEFSAPPSQKIHLLTVARAIPCKGLLEGLNTLKYLRDAGIDFKWILVGEGPLLEAIKARASALGLENHCDFRGAQSYGAVEALYQSGISAFFFPGVITKSGRHDGLPVAILEAMAHGVPVVSSRVGALDEAIQQGTSGLLFAPEDWKAAADHLRAVIDDSSLAQRLGEAGRARVIRAFSAEIGAQRLLQTLTLAHAPQKKV